MPSSPVDQQERARLRDKYNQAARCIIRELQSRSQPAYTHDELAQFRVSVQPIDPEDPKFTDSEGVSLSAALPEGAENVQDQQKITS